MKRNQKRYPHSLVALIGEMLLFVLIPLPAGAAEELGMQGVERHSSGHSRIPLQVKEGIKVVYQVSDDKVKDGVSKALFYAKKLLDTYNAEDVPDEQIDLHLVFHSKGTNALVNETTRIRLEAEGPAANPNVELIEKLTARGVSVELCESSMEQREVESEDLVKGVATVRGAFPRIISLQHLGFAYIKFE